MMASRWLIGVGTGQYVKQAAQLPVGYEAQIIAGDKRLQSDLCAGTRIFP